MAARSFFIAPRVLGLAAALALAGLGVAACADDEPPPVQPLTGSKPGTLRYIVHLNGEPPDATAYREALAAGSDKAAEIADQLKEQAVTSRKKFVQALKAYDGRVVDHWFLTNAVTVEIPAGNAMSLNAIDGVAKVEPDQILAE